MSRYILNQNKQGSKSGGDFEVHNSENCNHLPNRVNWIHLGDFANCIAAVRQAKVNYPSYANDINGCYWCSNSCHTD